MKIVVDAMGGDFGPEIIVEGAVNAANQLNEDKIILVGDNKILNELKEEYNRKLIKKHRFPENIEIIPSTETIQMDESPVTAIKQKPNSSIVLGLKLISESNCDSFISAGNTGAILTGAIHILGRLKNIIRPAIATFFPNNNSYGKSILLDVGANVDCKPIHLLQFAIMGSLYAKYAIGIESPRVALLNIGEEDSKGNETILNAFKLLKGTRLNFIGNMEGRDILNNKADVIVCDGLVGNIILKFTEGMLDLVFQEIKETILKSISAKIGSLLLLRNLKKLGKKYQYEEYGGALLLGTKGIVIITHGIASSKAIKNAILTSKTIYQNNINNRIEQELELFQELKTNITGG